MDPRIREDDGGLSSRAKRGNLVFGGTPNQSDKTGLDDHFDIFVLRKAFEEPIALLFAIDDAACVVAVEFPVF